MQFHPDGPGDFFKSLDRTFRLLTLSVVDYRGEVLNYVGDEVIVTWPERDGAIDCRPLRCFGAMRDELADAAPQLQRILMHALNEGGWFGAAHQSEVRSAAAEADEGTRVTRIETLLAEETRMGMLVGVAVGWQLAAELGQPNDTEGD